MIIGMTWREIKELWWIGPRQYVQDWFNWVDIFQLICYWTSIILNIVSFATLYEKQRQQSGDTIFTNPVNESIQYPVNGSYRPRDMTTEPFNVSIINLNHSNKTQHLHLLLDWNTYDTLFISEATFAIATVLTFLAVLHDAVILSFVGPLLVSFVGMIADIARFLLIFVFVWVSFGIGFTQLYQTFTELEEATCQGPDCQLPPFANLASTMRALFWSLFDLMDLDTLDSRHENMFFTETVGIILYGVYMIIAFIIMLNALIAMMNNTYNRVEENSEVEWKSYRTKLMAQYMTNSPTLPPPFNLVPTVKTLLWMTSCTLFKIHHIRKNDSYDSSIKEEQGDKYERLIRLVMERYIDELNDNVERDDQEQTDMTQDMATMKESIQNIRYELQEARVEAANTMREIKELCKAVIEFKTESRTRSTTGSETGSKTEWQTESQTGSQTGSEMESETGSNNSKRIRPKGILRFKKW
ncbi:short transient receptor potential channel 5-like isoform X3 [Amphiura filiformis]|uniref:short transient receptor potential channel 5-like isoform X1 n=1 Tax=Amphiura filiformis TaxID=82378 RepID=UPI003B21CACC